MRVFANKQKVETIVNMTSTKYRKGVCEFIRLVNESQYMWAIWSNILQPLTNITSNNLKFKLADIEQSQLMKSNRLFIEKHYWKILTLKGLIYIPM